jgi:hypothetical protein
MSNEESLATWYTAESRMLRLMAVLFRWVMDDHTYIHVESKKEGERGKVTLKSHNFEVPVFMR